MLALFWVFLVATLLLQGTQSRASHRQKRVVNGENVRLGEIPYQVSIQNIDCNCHHCGGIIVNAFYVVTAAHCMDGFLPDEFQVISGTVDLGSHPPPNYVKDIQLHENYIEKDWINDIALLRVTHPFIFDDNTAPAIFPNESEEVSIGERAVLSGFGRTKQEAYVSKVLKKTEITIKSLGYCKKMYEKANVQLADSHICAYEDGNKGMCKGDSGGPLILQGKVVGISIYTSNGCSDSHYPSVFTKISKYISWIQKHTV